ncbi:tRNA lysidine(34) synthetase TilS [Microbulbifer sp. 2205BS26-8]|uniref:tRNA lysidine(34) synthetase TilS n=1 Tax=Microbulbifer sp. 2205BS26-8 TaxID=3064386 RepID=UPI00273F2942|nr:tRNA lysidine(34) synthetase TilS [Microbulbifer sp. 2205BS26-8]MDP5209307.1 tRNA lysidine(34) synthetase TilS [Microbulbifer sp. 2205BS26-8]
MTFTTPKRLQTLLQVALQRHPVPGQLWVGFSGGLDSTVLLHLLASCQIPVRALHVHHGLSANADRWLSHCQEFACHLSVPFTAVQIHVATGKGGLEQRARRARYRAFAQVMSEGDQILLGHHGDDQAETFLLRLMRGAGVLGLAGIAESRFLGEGRSLLRPLLGASRVELAAWAGDHGLTWIDDESNADESLDRNYLRHSVLPLLSARWPARQRVMRAVENLRESAELLQALALADLHGCGFRRERFGESLALERFTGLSLARRKNLLRYWSLQQGGKAPEWAPLQQALEQLGAAAADARIAVQLGGRVVRRYQGRLYLTPELARYLVKEGGEQRCWDGISELPLPGGGMLAPSPGWPGSQYRVRYRRGGERAQPSDRVHSQTLKKLLQERALEPWLRDRVPLVYRAGELVAVGDLFTCDVAGLAQTPPPRWWFSD